MKTKMMNKTLLTALSVAILLALALVGTLSIGAAEPCASHTGEMLDSSMVCTTCSTQMVASVTADSTTAYYATLPEAFAAADGKTATVKLVADVVVPWASSNTSYYVQVTGGSITLDATEHAFSIDGAYGYIAYAQVFELQGGSLTVLADEAKPWTLNGVNTFLDMFYVGGYSTLKLDGGVYNVGSAGANFVRMGDSTAEIKNVTINAVGDDITGEGVVVRANSHVVLDNVTITRSAANTTYVGVLGEGASYGSCTLTIKGGAFCSISYHSETIEEKLDGDLFKIFATEFDVVDATTNEPITGESIVADGDFRILTNVKVIPCPHDGETKGVSNEDDTHDLFCLKCEGLIASGVDCEGGSADCETKARCDDCGASYGDFDYATHSTNATKAVPNGNGTHNVIHACCNEPISFGDPCTPSDGSEPCTVCGGKDVSAEIEEALELFGKAIDAKYEALENNIYTWNGYFGSPDYDYLYGELENLLAVEARSPADVERCLEIGYAALDLLEHHCQMYAKYWMIETEISEDSYDFLDEALYEYQTLPYDLFYIDIREEGLFEERLLTAQAVGELVERTMILLYERDSIPDKLIWFEGDPVASVDMIKSDLFFGGYCEELYSLLELLLNEDAEPGASLENRVAFVNYYLDVNELLVDTFAKAVDTDMLYDASDSMQFIYYSVFGMSDNMISSVASDMTDEDFAAKAEDAYKVVQIMFRVNDLYIEIIGENEMSGENELLVSTFMQVFPFYYGMGPVSPEMGEDLGQIMQAFWVYCEDLLAEFAYIDGMEALTDAEKQAAKEEIALAAVKAFYAGFYQDPEDPEFDAEAYEAGFDPCNCGLHRFGAYTVTDEGHMLLCERCRFERVGLEAHSWGVDRRCEICGAVNDLFVVDAYIDESEHLIIVLSDDSQLDAGKVGGSGSQALPGLPGADGKDGVDGKDGLGIAAVTINEKGELILTFTDETEKNLGVITGKDGVNGANGIDGEAPYIGENGNWWIGDTDTGVKAKGDKGDKGDKGETGAQGPRGEKGEKGADGKDGVSLEEDGCKSVAGLGVSLLLVMVSGAALITFKKRKEN